jgi:hypothetical protein
VKGYGYLKILMRIMIGFLWWVPKVAKVMASWSARIAVPYGTAISMLLKTC